jgi:hypothetical protein
MRNQEYSYESAREKSEKFLKDIVGQKIYDKFVKDGKIEIESDKKVYELYLDGRVINKTANQKYCIVPNRPDYPDYDIIAIKYAWLKYGIKTVEKVANKTIIIPHSPYIENHLDRTIGYDAFVHYMEENGWFREQKIINESNINFVTTNSVQNGNTGCIAEIRCPSGFQMTVMGTTQVPQGRDIKTAYSLSLRITNKDGKEISGFTKIRITKIKPSEEVIQLARIYYSDISISKIIGQEYIAKSYDELWRWKMGIALNGGEILSIYVVDSETYIPRENIKISMGTDIWAMRS